MTMQRKKSKAQSPYQKYQKAPYLYSETYFSWKRAAIIGNKDEAARLSRKHAVQFGYAA
jgi:hypothetical protein